MRVDTRGNSHTLSESDEWEESTCRSKSLGVLHYSNTLGRARIAYFIIYVLAHVDVVFVGTELDGQPQ